MRKLPEPLCSVARKVVAEASQSQLGHRVFCFRGHRRRHPPLPNIWSAVSTISQTKLGYGQSERWRSLGHGQS